MSHSKTNDTGDTAVRGAGGRPQEAEIARLRAALLELTANAVRERDADRAAIARELHDRFGQYLTVMELELKAAEQQDAAPPALHDRLQKLRLLTAETQQDMADMAWQLRPVSLQGMDLQTAATQLIEEWRGRSTLSFDLHLSLGSQTLPPLVETALYRVLQEAVTNVVKHAGATRIGVILRIASHEVLLIVEDDGGGFSRDQAGADDLLSRSLGLLGIRERLDLVGGTLEIESSPDQGATLLVRVPL